MWLSVHRKTELSQPPFQETLQRSTLPDLSLQALLGLTVLTLYLILVTPASAVTVDPPVAAGDAEIDWQWVGLDQDADTPCPRPSGNGWTVEKLFVPAAGGIPGIAPALRPFCLYSWPIPGSVPAPDLAALAALVPGQLSALERDSLSVTTAGALETALRNEFEREFLEHAGATPPLAPGSRPPHLAVVDTSRDDHSNAYRNVGQSAHGYTLLNLARALLCQGSPCGANISSSLAMPFYRQGGEIHRDIASGGTFGSVAELARGVQREVARWTALNTDFPLVLNLSLGWDPVFGGGEATVSAMPLEVRAAYAALADARCRGALAVAAAGNDPGGRITRGPIYPAAWEKRRAPDRAACTAALGSAPPARLFPPSGTTAYRPLVYAVSGIQADGEELANRRPGAGAPLVAYADHGTAPGASEPTAVLTGSSVAALIASSAAAQVWSHLPTLRADEVMGHVYQSGAIVGGKPDFTLSSSRSLRPKIRRASICDAQRRACTVSGGCSAPPPTCPTWDKTSLDLTPSVDLSVFETATAIDLSAKTTTERLPKACHKRSIALAEEEKAPSDPCPDRQYRSTQGAPWATDPQPGSSFCPSCPMNEATGTLLLETDDSDPTAVWTNPMLVLCSTTYDLDIEELSAGDVFEVTGISLGSCTEAWLTAITSSGGSVTSPLVIGSSS